MKICEEYASLLDPLIDGELTGDEAARVRDHLASCPACAAYAADATAIRAAFGDMEETQVPEGLTDGVMAAIRAHAVPQRKKNQWVKVAASLAACALVVFAVARVMPFSGSSGAAAPALASAAAAPSSSSGAADSSASMEVQTRGMEDSLESGTDNDKLTTGDEIEGTLYDAGAGSNEKTTSSAQAPESYGLTAPANMQADAGAANRSAESDAKAQEFQDQALSTTSDDASYAERLADLDSYVEKLVDPSMSLSFETENHMENGSAIAWYGHVGGLPPNANRYSLFLYLPGGTVASLPLPWSDDVSCALPDKMWFDGNTFVYEVIFAEDSPNLIAGEGFNHVKGTYLYTVDLTAKTVSLEIQQ